MLRRRTGYPITLTPEGPARPQWTVTPSPGERGSTPPLAQAQRPSSNNTALLFPWERSTMQPPHFSLPVVRRRCPRGLILPTDKEAEIGEGGLAQARTC